jgi:RNA recognition motif-containing protein
MALSGLWRSYSPHTLTRNFMQTNTLFVRNLSFSTTDGELNGLFAKHGEVVSTRIATERETGKPRGFAFVEMGDRESVEEAILALDNTRFNGRTMHVGMSEPRQRKPSTAYGDW